MNKLKSRRFWLAIISAIIPVVNEQFQLGLSNETIIAMITGLVAFILGESHVDAKRQQNGGTANGDSQYQVTESNK